MTQVRDVVILGGGHNGLVTAFYLAKAGLKPLVLERRPVVGGCATTEEFHPGFRCSRLTHNAGAIRFDIVRDMNLAKHGLRAHTPDVRVCSLSPSGAPLILYGNIKRSQQEIARFSPKDAGSYEAVQKSLANIGEVIDLLLGMTPPDIDEPASGNVWELLSTGLKLRSLGKKDFYRLLRWGPMAAADLVSEWFESELLKATLAAQGVFGTFLGPWSAGSSATLLLRGPSAGNPALPVSHVMGGIGALTAAMATAVQEAGGEIRTSAEVERIKVDDGVATGVILSGGEEIEAKAVVSNADPRRTLLGLIEPQHLDPGFLQKMRHYRANGTVAKLNLALGGIPKFHNIDYNDIAWLTGRILISPEIDYLERAFDAAKYGEFSPRPYIEATIPTLSDPSLAPPGKHILSIYAQYAPYELRADWDMQRERLGDAVIETLAEYAPELPGLIEAREVITPKDLERDYGLTGGHIYHGELALDQLFTMRPVLGWGKYRSPLRNLYLCGSGTHPGIGLTGGSGANAAREFLKDFRNS